ncbi:MAG: uroporphyrinogen-III C-methyltransferase [Burkholderiales bacterium]|nr:uroporphyrinogen-III C-methyltransferase [Burkholderiales bacterium]
MKHVALIGAGPGAADLITLRGMRFIQAADCILHDALVSEELLAMAPQAVKIAVGKRCGKQSTAQHFINKMLVDAAKKYPRVVRLKGGDPMVFGRADEEMTALREAGIEFEVVPGITTALAAASELQASLTLRGVSRFVALLTPSVGHGETPHAVAESVPGADTLVVYMGLKQAAVWAQGLLDAGRAASMPVIVAESVSLPHQQFTALSLGELVAFANSAEREGPCLILIGEAMAAAAERVQGENYWTSLRSGAR